MSKHRALRHTPPLIALILLALLAPAARSGLAARPESPVLAAATVQGNVLLPGGAPADSAIVWYAPLTAAGAFDWSRAAGVFTYLGTFSFSLAGPGDYGLVIDPPENTSSARSLRGYSFTIAPSETSRNLGNLTLPTAVKRIAGSLTLKAPGGDQPISGASVFAYNGRAQLFLSSSTEPDGSFSFGVEPGDWQVYATNQPGATWQVRDAPITLSFPSTSQPETAPAPLLAYPTVGTLVGRVLGPGGVPLAAPPPGATPVYVYAFGANSSTGRYEYLDSTGAFTMPVLADTYTLEVVIDQGAYPDLIAPPDRTVTVTSGTVTVPTITLQRSNAQLSGLVRDAAGPLAGVEVDAYTDGGQWRSATTGPDGRYSLSVTEGAWNVAVFPDEGLGFLQQDDFARVIVAANQSLTQNFTLVRAAAIVTGGFVEAGGAQAPLSDVSGLVYARDAAGEFVAWASVEGGSFSMSVPAGQLRVGVQLAAGSPYAVSGEVDLAALRAGLAASPAAVAAREDAPFEQALAVAPAQGAPPTRSVTIALRRNDAVITGTLRDVATGRPITGVPVVVSATPAGAGGAFQWAEVDTGSGTFSIPVVAGDWLLAYDIADDGPSTYAVPELGPAVVSVAAGGSASADIVLARRDGVIAGTLTSGGAPLANRLVWVSSQAFSDSTLSGPDGRYSISVPTLGPDGQEARYILGTDFACETVADCYFDIEPRPATVAKLAGGGLRPAQSLGNSIDANPVGSNGTDLLGLVVDANGNALSGQSVRNGNKGGVASAQEVGRTTSGNIFPSGNGSYNFRLPITYPSGGRPGRVTGRIKIAGTSFDVNTAIDRNVVAGAAGPAQEGLRTFVVDPFAGLPDVRPAEFDDRVGFTTTLADGTQIKIPPGAVPLGAADRNEAGQGLVRVTITPTYNLFPTRQFAEAGRYGFEIALTAVVSGRRITEDLLAPMQVTLRYGPADFQENGIRESQLRAARSTGREWAPAASFTADPGTNRLSFQTTQLGLWALVQRQLPCGQCIYLPYLGK